MKNKEELKKEILDNFTEKELLQLLLEKMKVEMKKEEEQKDRKNNIE